MFRIFLRMGGWVVALPLLLAIAAAVAAATDGRDALGHSTQLAEHGVETMATITGRAREDRLRSPSRRRVTFTFASGSITRGDFAVHRAEVAVSAGFYDRIQEGGEVPVRYLPDDPSVVELEPGALASEGWNAAGVSLVLVTIAFLLFLVVWRQARCAASLRRTGQRTIARAGVAQRRLLATTVEFTFTDAEGRDHQGRTLPRRRRAFGDLAPGRPIEILYDPADPRCAYWVGDLDGASERGAAGDAP